MDIAEDLLQKLKTLPPQRLAEVADFVDFLKVRVERERARKIDGLFESMTRLQSLEPPLTPEDIEAEIVAARADLRRCV